MAEIHIQEQTTPSLPQAGKLKVYADSTDNRLKQIDSSGVVKDLTDSASPVDNCRIGFMAYADVGTAGTPIVHVGGVESILTNDALGAQTLKTFKPPEVTELWIAADSEFDFSELKAGDMVDIRVDLIVTTTAQNQEIIVELELGQGGFSYRIPFDQAFYKTAGAHQISRYNGIYIGDSNTLDNPGQFILTSPDNATVVINGWYIKVLIRG